MKNGYSNNELYLAPVPDEWMDAWIVMNGKMD